MSDIPFGQRIKFVREHRRVDQRTAAEEIGIDKSALCRLEQGKTVRLEAMRKISAWAGACMCCGQSIPRPTRIDGDENG